MLASPEFMISLRMVDWSHWNHWKPNAIYWTRISLNTYRLGTLYKKAKSLELSRELHPLEMVFVDHNEQRCFISEFYSELVSLNSSKLMHWHIGIICSDVGMIMIYGMGFSSYPPRFQYATNIKNNSTIFCIIFVFFHLFLVSTNQEFHRTALNVRLMLVLVYTACGNAIKSTHFGGQYVKASVWQ